MFQVFPSISKCSTASKVAFDPLWTQRFARCLLGTRHDIKRHHFAVDDFLGVDMLHDLGTGVSFKKKRPKLTKLCHFAPPHPGQNGKALFPSKQNWGSRPRPSKLRSRTPLLHLWASWHRMAVEEEEFSFGVSKLSQNSRDLKRISVASLYEYGNMEREWLEFPRVVEDLNTVAFGPAHAKKLISFAECWIYLAKVRYEHRATLRRRWSNGVVSGAKLDCKCCRALPNLEIHNKGNKRLAS